jgi:hypothetical protein
MGGDYKKIASGARPGRMSGSRLSLWRGPDHLLQIERDHYTEAYRRFYYADIEIFTVRLDNRRRNIAIVSGIIVGALLLWGLYLGAGVGGGVVFGFAGFFLIPFVYNLVRGPSCVVHVTTAVHREELQSVRRVKGALKLMQVIRDGAAQSQGVLDPDTVRLQFQMQNASGSPLPPPVPTPAVNLPPPPISMAEAPAAPVVGPPKAPASAPLPPPTTQ